MIRKLLIAGAILLVGIVAVRKLHLGGYVSAAWHRIQQEARSNIPTDVEFERIEYEIAKLDNDIEALADPLAELDFDIKTHQREIDAIQEGLAKAKAVMKDWVAALDEGQTVIHWAGRDYRPDQIRHKLAETFANCRRLEQQLETKQHLLEAKRKRFDAIYDQAEKLASRKREFEIRLENLRTQEEILKAQRIVNRPLHKNGRVRTIDEALKRIEKQQEKVKFKIDILQREPFARNENTPTVGAVPPVDLGEIRNYVQPRAPNAPVTSTKTQD